MTSTHLFLSYSRDDAAFMRRLRTRLEESGIPCWSDDNLKPGTPDWQIAIENALDNAAGLVAIWTPSAKESRWMREELRYAAARDLPILPVLAEGSIKDAIPFGYSGMQFVDLRGSENLRLNFRELLVSAKECIEPVDLQPVSPQRQNTRLLVGLMGLLVIGVVVALAIVLAKGQRSSAQADNPASTPRSLVAEETDSPLDINDQGTQAPPQAVTSNTEWLPQIADFDGVEMMLVPPGCFTMGSESGRSDERPTNDICFNAPFWIDRYEVTNAAYGSVGLISGDRKPRESVNWFDAVAHCAERGARLPTEAEWEYAARGPDGLDYPWGSVFDGQLLNFCDSNCSESWADAHVDDGFRTTAFVGSYPDGASWVGAEDMAGNVWEWVNVIYRGYPYDPTDGREAISDQDRINSRVARGGSWINVQDSARSAIRLSVHPTSKNPDLGFRCAADY